MRRKKKLTQIPLEIIDKYISMRTTIQRYHWADVAKGILIILVMFHYLPQVALSKGWDTAIWNGANDIRYFYCCFFMATFLGTKYFRVFIGK